MAVFAVGAAATGHVAAQPAMPEPRPFYADISQRMATDPKGTRDQMRAVLAPADTPMPKNVAELDSLLAKKDYEALLATLSKVNDGDTVLLDLNWERMRMFDGAGILVGHAYVNDLWRLGTAMGARGGELRDAALAFDLYLDAVIQIDGVRCADPAAAPFRLKQLTDNQPVMWAQATKLSKADRDRTLVVALSFEALTAPVRQNDEVLCQGQTTGSMVEMIEGLGQLAKEGKQPKAVDRPGFPGQSYEVPRAPPHFLPPEQWRPKQEPIRAGIVDALDAAMKRGKSAP